MTMQRLRSSPDREEKCRDRPPSIAGHRAVTGPQPGPQGPVTREVARSGIALGDFPNTGLAEARGLALATNRRASAVLTRGRASGPISDQRRLCFPHRVSYRSADRRGIARRTDNSQSTSLFDLELDNSLGTGPRAALAETFTTLPDLKNPVVAT
jgi:hypothetical protein